MKEPVITEAELFAELDKLRKPEAKPCLFTDEQFKLVQYARTGPRPVTWIKIAEWFTAKGWGDLKYNTLETRYKKDCERRGVK